MLRHLIVLGYVLSTFLAICNAIIGCQHIEHTAGAITLCGGIATCSTPLIGEYVTQVCHFYENRFQWFDTLVQKRVHTFLDLRIYVNNVIYCYLM